MSGHSKWSTIKRQKGVTDAKRAQAFTKLANAIIIAVRTSGGEGNPNINFKLRLAVDKARAANMPKDNIERAIERGVGAGEKTNYSEVTYEGFGPGGVAVIVEAATDNKARTIQEVKNIFDRNGGTLGNPGAVSYQFTTKGEIVVKKNRKSFDDVFMIGAEAGAEDVEDENDEAYIYTRVEDLKTVRESLVSQGLQIVDAGITRKPLTPVEIGEDVSQKLIEFLGKLEDLDDVQQVYSNAHF